VLSSAVQILIGFDESKNFNSTCLGLCKDMDKYHKNLALSSIGDEDFWLVLRSTVQIQGHSLRSMDTVGRAATHVIDAGGPSVHGHKVEVGTLDFGVFTTDLPSFHTGAGSTLNYVAQGGVCGRAPGGYAERIWHIALPLGVQGRLLAAKHTEGLATTGQEVTDKNQAPSFCGDAGFWMVTDPTWQTQSWMARAARPVFSTGACSTLCYDAQDEVADEAPEVKGKCIVHMSLPMDVLDCFSATKHTVGQAATHQVVVGGPFPHNHLIEVMNLVSIHGRFDGGIEVDTDQNQDLSFSGDGGFW